MIFLIGFVLFIYCMKNLISFIAPLILNHIQKNQHAQMIEIIEELDAKILAANKGEGK